MSNYPSNDDESELQPIYDQVNEIFDKNEFKEIIIRIKEFLP